jgi:tetratricopeptide (TPR) repeat protein
MLYLVQDRYEEAEEQFLTAQAIARESVGEESTDYGILLNNLAELRLETGRFAEAEDLYRRALDIHRRTVGERSVQASDALYNLADLLQQTGRLDESVAAYEESLSIIEGAYGADHPDSVDTREKLEAVRSRLAATR